MGNVAQKSGAKAPVDDDGGRDDEDRVAPGHVDKKRVGALAHALIAGLLADGSARPSRQRISAAAAALPGLAEVAHVPAGGPPARVDVGGRVLPVVRRRRRSGRSRARSCAGRAPGLIWCGGRRTA